MNLTHDQIRAWRACWPPEHLTKVLSRHEIWTPELIAAQQDVPAEHRLWAVLRCCSDRQQRLLACQWAERALLRERTAGIEPRASVWTALEVARRYATGEATAQELAFSGEVANHAVWCSSDVFMAARESAAWSASTAAGDAWTAAWDAGRIDVYAAWDAAFGRERTRQISDVLAILEEETP